MSSPPQPRRACCRRYRWPVSVVLALAAAAAFIVAAVPNLTGQGLYYDELHQATGAFAYVGQEPEMFCIGSVCGLPVLNTSYGGAIKTAFYGIWMRLTGRPLTVVSWRLLGIFLAAAGLAFFVVCSRQRLSSLPVLIFVLFVISDATVILTTRHDWGPVALSFSIRLVFLGLWLAAPDPHGDPPVPVTNSGALGFVVGIALFDKLSSVVLLIPLLIIALTRDRPSRTRHMTAACFGVVIGSLPLAAANLGSLVQRGTLISLADVGIRNERSLPWNELLTHYFDLGRGAEVQAFILGRTVTDNLAAGWVVSAGALSFVGALALCLRTAHPAFSRVLVMIASYLGVGGALALLPARTWVHHWVLGTPFQYAAFALTFAAASGVMRGAASGRRRTAAVAAMAIVVSLLLARIPHLIALEAALARGEAAQAWHLSHTELGQFAASHRREAFFLASDWGVATQIYCLAQGAPNLVEEVFWDPINEADLASLLERSGKDVFYLVRTDPPAGVRPENTRRVEDAVAGLGAWVEVEPDLAVRDLEGIVLRKFVRR